MVTKKKCSKKSLKKSKKRKVKNKNPFIDFFWYSKEGKKYREKFANDFDKYYDEDDHNYSIKRNSYITKEMAQIWNRLKNA